MPQPLQRRGFLALLAGFVPAALLRGAAAPVSTPGAGSGNPQSTLRNPQSPTPLLPPPDQPPFDAARLSRWQASACRPLTDSADPILARLLTAARAGESLEVIYYGGSFPGTVRRLTPLALFTVDGFSGAYLGARCHWRQEVRTFNTARLAFEPLRLV